MKKLLLATAATAALSGAAFAEEVKVGVLTGFTGGIESLAPDIAAGAELAMKEVSDSGKFLDGSTMVPVRGDDTCGDSAAGTAAAERLVTSDSVKGIVEVGHQRLDGHGIAALAEGANGHLSG